MGVADASCGEVKRWWCLAIARWDHRRAELWEGREGYTVELAVVVDGAEDVSEGR